MYKYIFALIFLFSCHNKQDVKSVAKSIQNKTEELPIQKATKDSIDIKFITGQFNPQKDSSFTLIPEKYADRSGMFMKKEAYNSFLQMWEGAKKDGVNLVIRSAARNFDYQKGIWERKWTGKTILSNGENAAVAYKQDSERAKKILEYSSMPGTSRHHWGTDIDLNSFENNWFESGDGLALFNWLEENAHKYGYCRPYTNKGDKRPFGYNEEKWHWSYLPLSQKYTEFAKKHLKNKDIIGFQGSNTADSLDVVNKYILGINHSCNH